MERRVNGDTGSGPRNFFTPLGVRAWGALGGKAQRGRALLGPAPPLDHDAGGRGDLPPPKRTARRRRPLEGHRGARSGLCVQCARARATSAVHWRRTEVHGAACACNVRMRMK